MARVINADRSLFIGTPQQITELLGLLRGDGAAIVNVDHAQFITLAEPLPKEQLSALMEFIRRQQSA